MIVFNNDDIWSEQAGPDGSNVTTKQQDEAPQPQFSIVPLSFQSLADLYKGELNKSTPIYIVSKQFRNVFSIAANLNISIRKDLNEFDFVNSNFIRDSIIIKIENSIKLSIFALNRGYLLPTSPLDIIFEANKKRQLFENCILPQTEQSIVVKSIVDLINVYDSFKAKKINFERVKPANQISQFDISVDGIVKQTGDPLADILGYQPDGDFLKRKKAIDSIQNLNFTYKKPYFLFISKPQQGYYKNSNIVCFIKMKDANSYVIKKRDVFNNIQYSDIVLEKNDIQLIINELSKDNDFLQILSFYDWVSINEIAVFVDREINKNTIYSYSVVGMQNKLIANSIFEEKYSALQLSDFQISKIKKILENSQSITNPYSIVSSVLYDNDSYGWMICAINLIESKKRNESDETIRKYSYIASDIKLIDYILSNRFVIPNDIKNIENSINQSLSSYGVYQTLLSILDSIGLTYFMHGKDDFRAGVKPTKESLEKVTGGLSLILSSIDSKLEIVSSSVILTNLLNASAKNTAQINQDNNLKNINENYDLTTTDGLSKFINYIRYIYDNYPGLIS